MRVGSLNANENVLVPQTSLPVPNYALTVSFGMFAGEIVVTLGGAKTVVSILMG